MMALRARGEDENEIEWSSDQQVEVGLSLVLSVRRVVAHLRRIALSKL